MLTDDKIDDFNIAIRQKLAGFLFKNYHDNIVKEITFAFTDLAETKYLANVCQRNNIDYKSPATGYPDINIDSLDFNDKTHSLKLVYHIADTGYKWRKFVVTFECSFKEEMDD